MTQDVAYRFNYHVNELMQEISNTDMTEHEFEELFKLSRALMNLSDAAIAKMNEVDNALTLADPDDELEATRSQVKRWKGVVFKGDGTKQHPYE